MSIKEFSRLNKYSQLFVILVFLELPAEYLQTNLILSVSSDKVKDFEQSIIKLRARTAGNSRGVAGTWKAEPIQNAGNLVFISCLTNDPVNVPGVFVLLRKKK